MTTTPLTDRLAEARQESATFVENGAMATVTPITIQEAAHVTGLTIWDIYRRTERGELASADAQQPAVRGARGRAGLGGGVRTDTYTGAIPVASVTCPPWCDVPQQNHLDELYDLEGRCIHWNHGTTENGRCSGAAPDWYIDYAMTTFVDGTPEDRPGSWLSIHVTASSSLSPAEAEQFAHAILAAVEEARS